MGNETEILLHAVKAAGKAIIEMQKKGFSISLKENEDVLTQADLLANQIIRNAIHDAFPEDGWLSEENVDDLSRLKKSRVWIIDPIDGTREFVKNIPEYAISVALIDHHEPRLAVVFNPATDELFFAEKGKGAFLNDQQIHVLPMVNQPLTLLASRSEFDRGDWTRFSSEHVQVVGSIAYKLALVAAGRADATFSLGPKNEWDIAAGVLLVQEAGGKVTDQSLQSFLFNQPSPLVNGIVAASNAAWETVCVVKDV